MTSNIGSDSLKQMNNTEISGPKGQQCGCLKLMTKQTDLRMGGKDRFLEKSGFSAAI